MDYIFLIPTWQKLIDDALQPIKQRLKRQKQILNEEQIKSRLLEADLPISETSALVEAFQNYIRSRPLNELHDALHIIQSVLSDETGKGLKLELTLDYSDKEKYLLNTIEWMNFFVLELNLPGLDLPSINPKYKPYAEFKEKFQRVKLNSKAEKIMQKWDGQVQLANSPLSLLKIPQWQCQYCGETNIDPRGKKFDNILTYCHFEECDTGSSQSPNHRRQGNGDWEYCCRGTWYKTVDSIKEKMKRAASKPEKVTELFLEFWATQIKHAQQLPKMRSLLTLVYDYEEQAYSTTFDDILDLELVANIDSIQ